MKHCVCKSRETRSFFFLFLNGAILVHLGQFNNHFSHAHLTLPLIYKCSSADCDKCNEVPGTHLFVQNRDPR